MRRFRKLEKMSPPIATLAIRAPVPHPSPTKGAQTEVTVTYSPMAVLRTVLALVPSDEGGALGVIHLGAAYVSFSLFEGGHLSFIRTFRIDRDLDSGGNGGSSVAQLDRDALLRDMRFTLRACSQSLGRENPVVRLVLSGGGTGLDSLAAQLEAGLGVACRPLEWGDGLHAAGGGVPSPKNLARGACALGAALIQNKPFGKAFDLRRDSLSVSICELWLRRW